MHLKRSLCIAITMSVASLTLPASVGNAATILFGKQPNGVVMPYANGKHHTFYLTSTLSAKQKSAVKSVMIHLAEKTNITTAESNTVDAEFHF